MKVGSLVKLLLLIAGFCAVITVIFFFYRIRNVNEHVRKLRSSGHWHSRIDRFRNAHTPPDCIVFLGDGLTEHFDLSVFARSDVVNRGIIGDFTKSMNTRLEEIVQASPSKVFIMAGINDIREKLPLFLIKRHLKCMVETIREKSPGTQIYIQSILPIPVRYNFIDPDHHINKVILRMNKKMEKLCQQQNIKFIDLYPHFERDGELNPLFKDEFHGINREGYLLWIELIRPYVEK